MNASFVPIATATDPLPLVPVRIVRRAAHRVHARRVPVSERAALAEEADADIARADALDLDRHRRVRAVVRRDARALVPRAAIAATTARGTRRSRIDRGRDDFSLLPRPRRSNVPPTRSSLPDVDARPGPRLAGREGRTARRDHAASDAGIAPLASGAALDILARDVNPISRIWAVLTRPPPTAGAPHFRLAPSPAPRGTARGALAMSRAAAAPAPAAAARARARSRDTRRGVDVAPARPSVALASRPADLGADAASASVVVVVVVDGRDDVRRGRRRGRVRRRDRRRGVRGRRDRVPTLAKRHLEGGEEEAEEEEEEEEEDDARRRRRRRRRRRARALVVHLYDEKGIAGGASGVAAGLLHPYTPRGKLIWRGVEGVTETLRLVDAAEAAEAASDAERRTRIVGGRDGDDDDDDFDDRDDRRGAAIAWRVGTVRPARSLKQARDLAKHAPAAAARGGEGVVLSPENLATLLPGVDVPADVVDAPIGSAKDPAGRGSSRPPLAAALHIPEGVVLDTKRYLEALWDATRAHGAREPRTKSQRAKDVRRPPSRRRRSGRAFFSARV